MHNLKKQENLNEQIKIEKYTVKYDQFLLHTFRDIIEVSPKIKQTHDEGVDIYPPFDKLHQDLFDALYKDIPEKIPENRIDHLYKMNSEVMDAIMESQRYKELRNITRLDTIGATIATEALGDDVKKLIEEVKDKYKEFEEELEALQAAAGDGDEDTDRMTEAEKIAYEEAQRRLKEFLEKDRKFITKQERRTINKAMEEAIKEATATSDMITNWGLGQDPYYTRSDYQGKLEILNRLRNSSKLKAIAAMAGRLKRMALQTQREKVKRGVDAVYEVRQGNDIGRILPSEALKLQDPVYEDLFDKDFVEGTLLQYEYSGTVKKHKGPIIVCIDNSGSMSGQPEIFAKAVALGLLEIARVQKRSMYVIHFDSSSKEHLHTNSFHKKSGYSLEEILDMAEYFSGGGTEFEPPLDLSRDKIEEDGDFSKADIIFLTDGEAAVTNEWLNDYLKWKKARNVKIFTVLIDAYSNSMACIKNFSDQIDKYSALKGDKDDQIALSLFTAM